MHCVMPLGMWCTYAVLVGAYWVSLAGANMTLLPLMLAGESFSLSAAEVGGCFAMQAHMHMHMHMHGHGTCMARHIHMNVDMAHA